MKIKRIWRELIEFLKMISTGNRKAVPAIVADGWSRATLPFISLYFSAQILNRMLAGDYEACVYSTIVFLTLQFGIGILERACFQFTEALAENCDRTIRQRMASKAFELSYEEFEREETMDSIRRADNSSRGSGGVGDQIVVTCHLFQETFAILYALIFVGMLFFKSDTGENFFVNYMGTVLLLVIYVCVIIFNGKMGKKMMDTQIEVWHKNDHNNAMFSYLVTEFLNEKNAKDMRIYRMQEILGEKFVHFGGEGVKVYLESSQKTGKYSGAESFVNQLAAGAAYLFIGIKAYSGAIGVGDVLLYAGAINQAVRNINNLINEASNFSYRASYLKSYEEFLSRPAMSYDGTLPIEKRGDGNYEFEFHDVSFSYPQAEEEVLSHINLKFEIGKKLALVGRNGAGKTTLIKLLCRLYEPTSGSITLNGIDIRKYNYKEYTEAFSVVFQDFQIFSMPLNENVSSGTETDEERLGEVLDEVGLKERVEQMQEGLRTHLYNNNGAGVDISGGEAQRLAIARALYKDAPFVILDEPTAALDPIAEAEIYENFNRITANKTAVYISHRMSSCKFCDRIAVLDHGKIAEFGTHEALLKLGGIYAGLYTTQAHYYEKNETPRNVQNMCL